MFGVSGFGGVVKEKLASKIAVAVEQQYDGRFVRTKPSANSVMVRRCARTPHRVERVESRKSWKYGHRLCVFWPFYRTPFHPI